MYCTVPNSVQPVITYTITCLAVHIPSNLQDAPTESNTIMAAKEGLDGLLKDFPLSDLSNYWDSHQPDAVKLAAVRELHYRLTHGRTMSPAKQFKGTCHVLSQHDERQHTLQGLLALPVATKGLVLLLSEPYLQVEVLTVL